VLQGIQIQRLKAALHGGSPSIALDELDHDGVTPVLPDQHYNAACLYSTAARISVELDRGRDDYGRLAVMHLAQTAVSRPDYLTDALADPELVAGLELACVEKLCAVARSAPMVELAADDPERAVLSIVESVTPPSGKLVPQQAQRRRAAGRPR
jgi:hypothetical protein